MKKLFTLLLSAVVPILLNAQDIIKTEQGDLTITPIVHGTVVLSWNNLTIYVDPYGGAERFEGIANPDLIIITDIHGDHLNQGTLDALNTSDASFIVPKSVYDKLPEMMQTNAWVLDNGKTQHWKNLEVRAIPMYNLPETEDSRHPKGRGNGYVITVGGKNIYLSGDTEDIPEMRALDNIDVAFVCMNLPYTMDVDKAASAVNEFKPEIVYPYHYRGKDGLSDVEKFKNLVSDDVEVRLRNWYSE